MNECCGTCKHFEDGGCEKFRNFTDANNTCTEWESEDGEKFGIDLI